MYLQPVCKPAFKMNRAGVSCSFSVKRVLNQCSVFPRPTERLYTNALPFICQKSRIHTSSPQSAGHNKWSKIKRKKAVADLERSVHIQKYINKIISAIKTGGTADPEKNLKLSSFIDQAKSAGITKSNIESAIKKAVSKGDSNSAESVLLDGRGPSGCVLLIEALTDNIRRTRPIIRTLLEKKGGALGDSGSSAFNFEHKALVQLPATNLPADTDPLELAIEIGAEDVYTVSRDENEDNEEAVTDTSTTSLDQCNNSSMSPTQDYQFKCDTSDLRQVLKSLKDMGVEGVMTSFEYLPKTSVELSGEEYEVACELVDALGENEEVVDVYSNFVLARQEMDRL